MVRRIASPVFVGRVGEHAQLVAGLDAAERGEAGLALIGGEAGIGKTRLVTELEGVAAARGDIVLRGHCVEALSASVPFAPFVGIVRALLSEQRPRATPVSAGDVLARLVSELEPRPAIERVGLADTDRLQLFQAVHGLLGHASRARPLLVIVEDLHWADASSLDLLSYLAQALARERILLVGTFRTDELKRLHRLRPVLAELVRLPGALRLELAPLARTEVADQLAGIGGARPSDEVTGRIFARSDGNPFFVEVLADRGSDAELPATLRDVLASRLGTLSLTTRGVIRAVAAIGREATHELIARVTDLPDTQLIDALREAIDQGVLVRSESGTPAGVGFRHALFQEHAYEELLPSERIDIHRAIVAALREGAGPTGEIARHAMLGYDLPTGLASSVQAADEAIYGLAFAEALAHLERALALWDVVDQPERVSARDETSILALAARSAGAIGLWRRALDLGRAALVHLDPVAHRDARVSMQLEIARWAMFGDDEAGRTAALLEAAALVPPDPPSALRARVLTELGVLASHGGRTDEAWRHAQAAVDTARLVGARPEEARALVRLASLLAGSMIQPAAAELMLLEAEQIVLEAGVTDEGIIGSLRFQQADIALQSGAFGRAIEIVDAEMARAARAGTVGGRAGFLRPIKLDGLASLGRWEEAEALVSDASHDVDLEISRQAVRGFTGILLRQGRTAEAAAAVRRTDHGYDTPHMGTFVLASRIRLAWAERRWDAARAAVDEAVGLFEDPAREVSVLSILGLSVSLEADRADHARGRRRAPEADAARRIGLASLALFRRSATDAIARGGAGPLIAAELAEAEAEGSRLDGASDASLWQEVVRRREALSQPWETAYARYRQAQSMLASGGHKQEVLALLTAAHLSATELGARPLVDQIETLARRGRVRLATAPAEPGHRRAATEEGVVVELTTREREVLSLVAAGHTNREIGDRLFISNKTASVHISNAMDKLGALSRYDAALIATRIGLLDAAPDGGAMS